MKRMREKYDTDLYTVHCDHTHGSGVQKAKGGMNPQKGIHPDECTDEDDDVDTDAAVKQAKVEAATASLANALNDEDEYSTSTSEVRCALVWWCVAVSNCLWSRY